MRFLLKHLCCLFVCLFFIGFIFYTLFVIANWDFNIGKWSEAARQIYVIIISLLFFTVIPIYFISIDGLDDWMEKKNQEYIDKKK